ncbi:MAG: phosphodiester glycosidase family protein [Bacteroidales bacterium]|nr:phosphodiester glycosidase family protein [Bacteroidales bacterium]
MFLNKATTLLACVSLLLGLSSCVRELNDTTITNDSTTLSAGIQQVEPEGKTSLSEGVNVLWTEGDAIRVYNADFSSSSSAVARSSGSYSLFDLETSISGDGFCAVYPASASSPAGGDAFASSAGAAAEGYALRTRNIVFSTQRAVADGFDPASTPMAAVKGSNAAYTFVNFASLLQFTLAGNGIASVVVESNKGNVKLAGSFLADCADSNSDGVLDSFSFSDDPSEVDGSATITLLPPAGSSVFAPGTYYVAVRPDITVNGGIRLTSYDATGNPMRTLAGTANVTLNRGKIRPLGSLAVGSDLERLQACSAVSSITQLSTRTLATGIQHTDYQVTWTAHDGLASEVALMHVVRFDREKATAAGAKIRTLNAFNGVGVVYDGSDNTYTRQTIRNMMICADSKEETVVFGTGASFNDNGTPNGPMHKDGVILYDQVKVTSRTMAGVKADNTMYIGYQTNWTNWTEAQRANYTDLNDASFLAVNGGKVQTSLNNNTRYGISAEGYTVRGSVNGDIYFVVVDPSGYGSNTSCGATYREVAYIMQALGCERAAYGQSGVTTAMWARNPQSHILEPLGDGNFDSRPLAAWGITVPGKSYTSVRDAIAASAVVKSVNSSSETTVRPGCSYTKMSLTMSLPYNTAQNFTGNDMGDKLNIWVLRVDPAAAGMSVKVLMKNDSYTANASSFGTDRLDNMAKAYVDHTGKQPLIVINGDFYETSSPYNPVGPVHARGKAVRTKWASAEQKGRSFIGIRSDNTIYIGDKDEYSSSLTSTYPELMGAGLMFLKDGKFNPSYVASTGHWVGSENSYIGKYNWPGASHPRMSMGYDDNGVIYVICADGRNAGTSKGACYVELCEMFKSLGCVRAVNLDGGKSSQFIKWNSGTSYSILNDPRDDDKPVGTQMKWRAVSDGFAFVAD